MYKDATCDVRYLKGVGPARAESLEKLDVETIEDLLYYFPRRYEDRTNLVNISSLKVGEYQTIKGKILEIGQRGSFRGRSFKIFETIVEDDTGSIACVWFNQPYLRNYFKAGSEVVLYGKPDIYAGSMQLQNPEYEIIDEDDREHLNYGRIVPVYSLAGSLKQRMLRNIVKLSLDEYLPVFPDILPYDIRRRNNLMNIAEAIHNLHFPKDTVSQEAGYRRIVFEECFLMQLMFGLKRLKQEKVSGTSHKIDGGFLYRFEKALPFELTSSQKKAVAEIRADMIRPKPMHRLLQGDVGSGKTIVALYACLACISSGHQAAFMVPTEILAEQHYRNIMLIVAGLRSKEFPLNMALLTSSLNKKEKEIIYRGLKDASINMVIGTHALIQGGVDFKSLGLVVIDEQHKFGVYQRLSALAKGVNPDCLVMTATPIPRTLAMTIYADLDISTLNEMPKGRRPIKTYLIDESKRQQLYSFIREKLKSGRQAYIVYPIIDESQKLDLKAASSMYEDLRRNVFSDFKVGLVHGRMKQEARGALMNDFNNGKVDLLVSTIVIEVGIDISNASIMVIEHAERFGLSQLHQLRGRIGRGHHDSYCILIGNPASEEAALRLKAIVKEADGFKIAEKDLEIRGPGEFFGARQHGVTSLRVNPLNNLELINIAKEEAQKLLTRDSFFSARQNQGLLNTLRRRFPDYDKLIAVS